MLPALIRTYFSSGPTRTQTTPSRTAAYRDDVSDSDSEYEEEDDQRSAALRMPPIFFSRLFAQLAVDRRLAREPLESDETSEGSSHASYHSDSSLAIPSDVDILLVCRDWLENGVPALYANPPLQGSLSFAAFIAVLSESVAQDSNTLFDYASLVEGLEISGAAADNIEMGDLETSLGLCNNLQRFRLASCFHISSKIVQSLADYAPYLSILDLEGCPVGDGYLSNLVAGCPNLKYVNFNSTNVTFKSLDVILTGLAHLESLCLDGAQPDDDDTSGSETKFINVAPARARRASFIAAAANADVAAKRAAGIRGPTARVLTRVSLSGGQPSVKDMKTLAYRAPNITHITLSGCDNLTDEHVKALLDGLCIPSAAKNGGPKLADLDLDGCELLTDATAHYISAALVGVAKPGQVPAPRGNEPANSMLELLDGVGRLKFLTASPLKVVGLSATLVNAASVRQLVRECGALEMVRLDACESVRGTFVEAVAEECWARFLEEKKEKKLAAARRSKTSDVEAAASGGVSLARKGSLSSRLPVPSRRNSSTGTLTPPRSPAVVALPRVKLPADGWCRLVGRTAINRLAGFEGAL
ncbi:hypothetical protein CcCBS67573_g01313 [Chytriomyces confervae]|uniref:F-box domain-containing protein n=1 Tax=Chytriomyces confervae TaxID=246404 RepID=A0A507FP30_9FUNG|nr:hypothetical protein HDU80_009035 [Chytriomyces hyalinus]TPX77440.1 hypothetical protein CcCBS67573_g01313 [Chytriomyces confervae]